MKQAKPGPLFAPLQLPCGVTLKNRIAKSAMSDSLGDGTGHPSQAQHRLYERWALGGLAVSIIGEVQVASDTAEKPGNLVLNAGSDLDRFRALAASGTKPGAQLWIQLGHAGAMAYPPISTPKGPSTLNLPGLSCAALTTAEIQALPDTFARTAALAKVAGLTGVQIHAAHGFLLSQFLSPLFNKRSDAYGGSICARMRLLLETIEAVRGAVGAAYPVAVKLNATDQLEGGLTEQDALKIVTALDDTSIDLIDISGGTYFPGAKSASDSAGKGPYFLGFARRARGVTSKPLMATGGFKTRAQAHSAITDGSVDMVGLARALVLHPDLPNDWQNGETLAPEFPSFANPPEGGITAWYTMRLTQIGEDRETAAPVDLKDAVKAYDDRDAARVAVWNRYFGSLT